MSTTCVEIPKLLTSKLSNDIQDNILNKLFGSEYTNLKILFQMLNQVTNSAEYEFELRFAESDDTHHVSKSFWLDFFKKFESDLELINYDDDIIYNYSLSIPLTNVRFRSSRNSKLYERKLLINEIHSRPNDSIITPLIIKLSKETHMSPSQELKNYRNIQRRQRLTYKFKSPTLANNWRIDATCRLFAETNNNKKLQDDLTIDNVINPKIFDLLDIEFEFIGSFKNLTQSFFELIQLIYTPYEYFNTDYILIKNIISTVLPTNMISKVNNIINILPQPMILTNDVLQTLNLSDYVITNKQKGDRTLLVIFENTSSIYIITEEYIKLIHGTPILNIDYDKRNNLNSTIQNTINNITKSKNNLYVSQVSIFDAILYENTLYVTDVMIKNNKLVSTQPYNVRFTDEISLMFNQFKINDYSVKISSILTNITSWNELITSKKSFICKPINEPLLTSKIYKISYRENITFDFKTVYVPIKHVFYLYSLGQVSNSIESKTINNKYSPEHFGYSMISSNASKNVMLLYASPYMRNSFILLNDSTDEFISQMYSEPLKYSNRIIKYIKQNDKTWKPISICHSTQPDLYTTSLHLESLIFDPLKYSKPSQIKQLIPLKNIYTLVSNLLNQYTIEQCIPACSTIIDIMDDNQINANNLFNLVSAKSIFAVSSSKHALTTYIEQAVDKTFSGQVILPTTRLRKLDYQFDIQIVHSDPVDYEHVITELNKKWNYSTKSIDVMFIENINFIVKHIVDIIKLRKLAESILSPNGIIVIKLFDGNKLEEVINKSNNEKINMPTNKTNKFKRSKPKLTITYSPPVKFTYKTNVEKPISDLKLTVTDSTLQLKYKNKTYNLPKINNYDFSSFTKTQLNQFGTEIITSDIEQITNINVQTIFNVSQLFNNILGCNVELFSHPYLKSLSESYSYEDSVEIISDEECFIENSIFININTNQYDLSKFIQSRKSINYSTVMVRPKNSNLFDLVINIDKIDFGIIFPMFVSQDDKAKLVNLINTNIKRIDQPDFYALNYTSNLLLKTLYLNLFNDSFKEVNIINPLTLTEISTYISSNCQFLQFDLIDDYISTYSIIVLKRI